MPDDASAGAPIAEVQRRLLDCSPYAVLLVGSDLIVRWAGGAIEAITGFPADEVRGRNVLDFVDVEWSPVALDSVGAALVRAGLQRAMLFRVRRKDGSTFVAEVQANSQWHDPLLDGMAVYLRPCDERFLLDEVVAGVAADAPLRDTLTVLARVMGAETLAGDGVVMTGTDRALFSDSVTAADLPHELVVDDGTPGTPWRAALEAGEPTWARTEHLPPPVRQVALAAGYAWCWAWPIKGFSQIDGCLVLWRRDDEEPDHTCRLVLDNLVRTTGLILQREEHVERLRHAAVHDPLTDLANRARFFEHVAAALDKGPGPMVGVLYVDLDRFKPVNDRLGHAAGDQVLRVIGRRLQGAVRERDLVARLGGDEFAIVCDAVTDEEVLRAMAARVTLSVGEPISIGSELVHVGASVGIATARPGVGCPSARLIDAADAALYEVKASGRGSWRLATPVTEPA